MWTPRRIGLALLGLAGAIAAYLGYSTAFGSIDGLPVLPEKYCDAATGQQRIDNYPVSRTDRNLAEAFGASSLEVTDANTYKTKIELQAGATVIASGPPNPDNTPFVVLSPISLVQFGKPTPGAPPGETREITTFHADKARLKFDRPISSIQDITDKAKLIEVELISNPDLESTDPRRGKIEIINNQRSADRDDHLVIRSVGPMFYRVPDETAPYNPDVAHIWTAAAVEVIDRRNLPRTLRGTLPAVAFTRSDDLRRQSAIADILLGYALPPPTITADGMMIYLQPDNRAKGAAAAPIPSPGKSNTNSVREIQLLEHVQMNLWSNGGSGLPGGDAPAPMPVVAVKSVADSPLAMPALLGSVWDGAGTVEKLMAKSLMVIETPGSFRYNLEKNTALFEIAAQAPPAGQANLVTVTRLSALRGQDNLFCNELLLDFSSPAGPAAAKTAGPTPNEGGFVLRTLTAKGPQVYLSVEADGLVAQGTELRYERDARVGRSVTTLRGSPAYAKREGSQIWGGDAVNIADIVIDSLDAPPKSKDGKMTTLSVNGPGRLEMFDGEQKKITGTASWGKYLKHEKIAGQKQELLKFEGPGRFADTEGEFRLTGDKLWLWLATAEKPAATKVDGKATSTNATPEKLIAEGNVEGGSPEMIIQKTDKLFVNFRDVAAPKLAALAPVGPPPAMIAPKASPVDLTPPAPPVVAAPAVPEKEIPNPTYLSAAVIHANVVRYHIPALPRDPKRPVVAAPGPSLKYELESAICEDRVIAYQNPDPKDPAKPTVGLLIKCVKLNLDQSAAGSVMKCTGIDGVPAEVHFEGTSLYGPIVDIDQPNNTVRVDGAGLLVMASGADLNGKDLAKPADLKIVWAKEMRFYGARSKAEFLQSVNATQIVPPDAPALANGPARIVPLKSNEQLPAPKDLGEPNLYTTRSTLQGHRLDLTFDKPIYFNQMKKKAPVPDPKTGLTVAEEKPKLKTAVTTPVPDDERAQYAGKAPSRDVYFLEEVFDADNKYVSARRLRAKQIDFANRQKEQELFAAGEGELRILQFEKNEDEAQPVAAAPNQRVAKKPESGEMKLTVVNFNKQMVAKDQGKLYQEAVFDKGATAFSIPTDNLNLQFEKHALPKGSVVLTCVDSLTVSSSQSKKDTKPVQWMIANGNAEFRNDTYLGIGGRVTYNGQQFIFDGTPNRLATLSKLQVGVGRSEYHQAEQLIYKKDGTIKANKSAGATLNPGG